jgi:cytochrome P450
VSDYPVGAAATLDELTADPHPLLARLRAAEPVSWLPALGGWLVTGYDLALRVMRDPNTFTVDDPRFSTAQVIGPSMLSLDGPAHARHREPFGPPFRPGQVRERFVTFLEREADRLISAIRPARAAELRSEVAGPLAVAVVAEALGLVEVEPATVLSWYAAIVHAVSEVTAGRAVPAEAADAFGALRASVQHTIAAGHGPVLGEAARELARPEVVSNAAVLMFGGIDTTDGMIVNAVRHLLLHPEAGITGDPGLLANAVEESIRLEPAAAVVDRYATADVTLGASEVRRGDLVRVSITGANRDPAVFADPDRFDVRRANARANLAFAQGPHFCLGAQLARAETAIAVRLLLDRLPGLRLDPAYPHAPHGLVFRKPPALHVLWG